MANLLDTLLQRRAIRAFDPAGVPPELREKILNAARSAPSSFNIQPYKFIWIESPQALKEAARLCMGQSAAATAPALVVAVADLDSWRETAASHLAWMREVGFAQEKIAERERNAALGRWFFLQGWFGVFGYLKALVLSVVHFWKIIGSAPVGKRGMFQWATKSTALACQNLMIAAEAVGLSTCPMEGFDGRRLSKFLRLSSRCQEIVMVIAVGKKSASHGDTPQWRRPIEETVQYL